MVQRPNAFKKNLSPRKSSILIEYEYLPELFHLDASYHARLVAFLHIRLRQMVYELFVRRGFCKHTGRFADSMPIALILCHTVLTKKSS